MLQITMGECFPSSSAQHYFDWRVAAERPLRLYFAGNLYIIDVSQSVESDHPHALDFLKRDCVNAGSSDSAARGRTTRSEPQVNSFFGKRMLSEVIPVKRLFDFARSLSFGNQYMFTLWMTRLSRVICRGWQFGGQVRC